MANGLTASPETHGSLATEGMGVAGLNSRTGSTGPRDSLTSAVDNTMAKERQEEGDRSRRVEPLHRERSRSEDRSLEREYEEESRHLKAGHVRCGGGWRVIRKRIERGDQ